jgi:DNA-directed RNA polymerase subunit M/transcription elongation factor TFIIS
MPNKQETEHWSREVEQQLCGLYSKSNKLSLPKSLNSRLKAKEMLLNSAQQNPLVTARWLTELENSLFYATGCLVDKRYLRLVRDSVANLKRSRSAHLFAAEAWPFLPLTVLSRDNVAVHLERIEQQLKLFEKTQQIDALEKPKLLREIGQYEESQPELFAQLCKRLELRVETDSDEDWQNETCPHCSSRRTRCTGQFQIHSADEPMTTYYACQTCRGTFTDAHR